MSVVLVIAVGLFFLRDNIAKFINNAATQIADEESNDGMNEYGFYFGKSYFDADAGIGYVFYEDGSMIVVDEDGNPTGGGIGQGGVSYTNGSASLEGMPNSDFSSDGKTFYYFGTEMKLQE